MNTFITRYEQDATHIMIPTALFSHPNLKELSGDALLLYGMLLCIQEVGNETDENGKKCIHITLKEIAEVLRCGTDKASRIYHELNKNLITTKKYADGHTVTYVNTSP